MLATVRYRFLPFAAVCYRSLLFASLLPFVAVCYCLLVGYRLLLFASWLRFATVCCCSGLERNDALKKCLTCTVVLHWPDTVSLSEEQPGLDSSLRADDRLHGARCCTPVPVRVGG